MVAGPGMCPPHLSVSTVEGYSVCAVSRGTSGSAWRPERCHHLQPGSPALSARLCFLLFILPAWQTAELPGKPPLPRLWGCEDELVRLELGVLVSGRKAELARAAFSVKGV